jgi:hypothetical protein
MKKNAILIAGIMFAANAAAQAQNPDDITQSPSRSIASDPYVNSTEDIDRAPTQAAAAPSADTSVTVESTWENDASSSESGSLNEYNYSTSDDSDIKADSSIRGGSLDARGHDQDANDDEIEPAPDPINPGKQADSSIRGGSIYARERNWNHDQEPSSGVRDHKRYMKADSSIRGGSLEARGGREARWHYEQSRDRRPDADLRVETHDDFGQGSSETWESDKAHGSVRGSANWNPEDDLLRDGMTSPSHETYEFNNDASVGGAARGEVGEGSSTLDDEELQQDESFHSEVELNSSDDLEENISGEYDIDEQISMDQPANPDLEFDAQAHIEAAGRSAGSESGQSSSDSEEFESNDPALKSSNSPLGSSGNEPNFLYNDNRALGVGSAATGESGAAAVAQSGHAAMMDNDELAKRVKDRLSNQSGTQGLFRHEVKSDVQVTANNGEVTLKGTVPSERAKQLLEVQAMEIAGVKKVHNQLVVAPESDSIELDSEVQREYQND